MLVMETEPILWAVHVVPSVDVCILNVPDGPFAPATNSPRPLAHITHFQSFEFAAVCRVQDVPFDEVITAPLSPTATNKVRSSDQHTSLQNPVCAVLDVQFMPSVDV